MKRFIIKTSCFIPILALIMLTNYLVDPGLLFIEHEYEKGIAEILSRDENVANITNFDERLVQQYYIEMLKKPKELIVIGSSRSLQIDSSIIHGFNMFNSSVSGASLEDYIAIYRIYKDEKKIPQKIILGIDPWIFNINNDQKRWKSIQRYYYKASEELGFYNKLSKSVFLGTKNIALISLSYFQASIELLIRERRVKSFEEKDKINDQTLSQGDYYATLLVESDIAVKTSEGRRSYPKKFREASEEEVKKKAISFISNNNVYTLESFKHIDNTKMFAKFIDEIQKDGVELFFYLPPYHPIVYDYLQKNNNYKIIVDVEEYLINIANDKNIKVFGSYNPARNKCTNVDFFDGMHPKQSALKKIFNDF